MHFPILKKIEIIVVHKQLRTIRKLSGPDVSCWTWDQGHYGEHHFCFLPWFPTFKGGMVNFTLRLTTNEMISICTSQTDRSWVVKYFIFAGLWRCIRGSYSAIWILLFWPLISYSDSPTDQTYNQLYYRVTDIDLHRITSSAHGAYAASVACQQGTLTLPDTWFHPTVLGPAYAPIVETSFPAMSFLELSHGIPLGTFSILLLKA